MRRIPSSTPTRVFTPAFGFLFFAAATALARPAVLDAPASNVLAEVSAQYAGVSNLTCTVRREVPVAGRRVSVVSRVAFARGNRMNVETLSPSRRRFVMDGEAVWGKEEDEKAPTRTPIAEVAPNQRANIRSVPGSPEELLAPFAEAESFEDVAEPDAPYVRQVVLRLAKAKAKAAVVSFDDLGRVVRIEAFADEARTTSLSAFSFSSPLEVLPGVWIFRTQKMETSLEGRPVKATSRFDDIRVNERLPASMFDPKAFF